MTQTIHLSLPKFLQRVKVLYSVFGFEFPRQLPIRHSGFQTNVTERHIETREMPESKLHVVFVGLIIRRIFYASSAWGGSLNSQQINMINAFFRKAHRFRLCSSTCLCDMSEYLRLADCI